MKVTAARVHVLRTLQDLVQTGKNTGRFAQGFSVTGGDVARRSSSTGHPVSTATINTTLNDLVNMGLVEHQFGATGCWKVTPAGEMVLQAGIVAKRSAPAPKK